MNVTDFSGWVTDTEEVLWLLHFLLIRVEFHDRKFQIQGWLLGIYCKEELQ